MPRESLRVWQRVRHLGKVEGIQGRVKRVADHFRVWPQGLHAQRGINGHLPFVIGLYKYVRLLSFYHLAELLISVN